MNKHLTEALTAWNERTWNGNGIDEQEFPTLKDWLWERSWQLGGNYQQRYQEWLEVVNE